MALPGVVRQRLRNLREPTNVCCAGQGQPGAVPCERRPRYFLALPLFSLSAVSFAHAESGLASYYGYGKAGKGELTCAHRTRPFGSVLRVSYGSRSIQCRVNDRGPFIRGRIVDLSVPAARALGMMSAGVVRVSVE
ncbi:rare lipoprotein A [Bradyrhizobium sp. LB1.3]